MLPNTFPVHSSFDIFDDGWGQRGTPSYQPENYGQQALFLFGVQCFAIW